MWRILVITIKHLNIAIPLKVSALHPPQTRLVRNVGQRREKIILLIIKNRKRGISACNETPRSYISASLRKRLRHPSVSNG
jgi:hypothetical protein